MENMRRSLDRLNTLVTTLSKPGEPLASRAEVHEIKGLLGSIQAQNLQLEEDRAAAVDESARAKLMFAEIGTFAHVGTWHFEVDTQRAIWSEEVLRIHEVDIHADFPLEDALDFYPEPDRQMIADKVSQAMEQQQPFQFEADLLTARGNLKRVRSSGRFDFTRSGSPALIGVFQDITENYNRIRELEDRLNAS